MAVKDLYEANAATYAFRAEGLKVPPPRVENFAVYEERVLLNDAFSNIQPTPAPPPEPKPAAPVKPLRDQIIEACDGRSKTSALAVYGPLGTNGKWHQINSTACHASLLHTPSTLCRAHVAYLLSITPQKRLTPKHREANIAYYTWLLGPESPYRSVVKDFNPDPEFALDYGIVVGDLDTAPVNVIYHFFIATRLIYEINLGQVWYDFVKAGLHPAVAFLATYTPEMGGNTPSHSAFPVSGILEPWLVNFANGTPHRVDGCYRSLKNHNGADTTWGPVPSMCKMSYVPGPDCWDQWAKNHPDELWRKKPLYPCDPNMFRVPQPYGPKKPSRIVFRPKDRESGIKILLAEQERILGR